MQILRRKHRLQCTKHAHGWKFNSGTKSEMNTVGRAFCPVGRSTASRCVFVRLPGTLAPP
jgi:hypothetical protein